MGWLGDILGTVGGAIPVVGGAISAIAGAGKQNKADQATDDAMRLAREDYEGRAPLRNRFMQGVMAPMGQAPDLSAIFSDPGNPFNRTAPPPQMNGPLYQPGQGGGPMGTPAMENANIKAQLAERFGGGMPAPQAPMDEGAMRGVLANRFGGGMPSGGMMPPRAQVPNAVSGIPNVTRRPTHLPAFQGY